MTPREERPTAFPTWVFVTVGMVVGLGIGWIVGAEAAIAGAAIFGLFGAIVGRALNGKLDA